MNNEIKNIFISHAHEDDEQLGKFRKLLGRQNYDIRDASIDSRTPNDANDPDYIKYQILAPGINWAGVMVVIISPDTYKSEYVNWEIEYAHKMGKRIVGVWCPGAKDSDLPENFERYGDDLVDWQSDKIIDAINNDSQYWNSPDGSPRPEQNTPRYSCG